MDRVTAKARSRIMSLVKSRNGKTTERRFRAILAASGVSGWQMNCSNLPGKPDFVFWDGRLVIFVDGCFWHGCACKRLSKTRKSFWSGKLKANQARDRRVSIQLRNEGWSVVRVKECELKSEPTRARILRKIKKRLQMDSHPGFAA